MKLITTVLRGVFVTLCVIFTNSVIMSLYHFEYPYWQDLITIDSTMERYLFFYLTLAMFAVFNAVTLVYAFKIFEHLWETLKGALDHANLARRKTRRQEDADDN